MRSFQNFIVRLIPNHPPPLETRIWKLVVRALIGKSESLGLLAFGVGIPNHPHLMLLSGGDKFKWDIYVRFFEKTIFVKTFNTFQLR